MADDAVPKSRDSDRDKLFGLAQSKAELFHTGDGKVFADVKLNPLGTIRATYPVQDKSFRGWLRALWYGEEKKGTSDQVIRDVVNTLEAVGVAEGVAREVFVRVAPFAERVTYLDMANSDWQAVRIDDRDWQITESPPVRFWRRRAMKPLPRPIHGGTLDRLWHYFNVQEQDRSLIIAWLLMALRPNGPYPVLVLRGEQGSAKSTFASVLRSLLDPYKAKLRSLFRKEDELFIAAQNSWLLVYDNVSTVADWQSDALCRIATGGGLSKRELYTDGDEVIFDSARPVILNGIEDIAGRNDLRDRALILDLPTIPEERRHTEQDFWKLFDDDAGQLLGALLDAAVLTLRAEPTVRLERKPRMADFARLGVAAEKALRWPPGSFLDAYNRNRAEASAGALDDISFLDPLNKLLDRVGAKGWDGAATELLQELATIADCQDRKRQPRGWPSSPKAMSSLLHRFRPNLRQVGIILTPPTGSHKHGRRWHIIRADAQGNATTVPFVPTVPQTEDEGTEEEEDSIEDPFRSSP
jgi:hypothetical protein